MSGRDTRRGMLRRTAGGSGPASETRQAVERGTGVHLVYLASLPRWIPFLLVVGLVAVGLLAGDAAGGWVGFLTLGAMSGLLGWLAYLSWPSLDLPGRVVRVLATAVLFGVAVSYLIR